MTFFTRGRDKKSIAKPNLSQKNCEYAPDRYIAGHIAVE